MRPGGLVKSVNFSYLICSPSCTIVPHPLRYRSLTRLQGGTEATWELVADWFLASRPRLISSGAYNDTWQERGRFIATAMRLSNFT
jgi:hypothetical protein